MRRVRLAEILLATTLIVSATAHAGTYPQLVSTGAKGLKEIPVDADRPNPSYDFVDRAKLPKSAKVLSAAKAANGNVWVVTDRGVFRSSPGGFAPLEVGPREPEPGQPEVPGSAKVVQVASDRIGHIWAATTRGLFATDGAQWWQGITKQDGVPYEAMTCLHLAPNGDVWGGTREGAWRLRDGEFRYFWGKRWLPGNVVRAIWTDAKGRAWLDTDGGLARIEEIPITLAAKAEHFDEVTQSRHDRRGFVQETNLTIPGDPTRATRLHISDNDGLWTAIYLGAMAFRHAATGDPAARAQARKSMDALLELERLSGIPGFPARAVATDQDLKDGATGVNFEDRVHAPGETAKVWYRSPVDPTVWCKGDTSSDEIDGHYFAWYVYHDLVADAAEKAKVAAVVRRVTDHILDHGYTLVDHTGRKTRWGIWAPELINQSPFYFEQRELNSIEILCYLKVAAHITGDAKYAKAYNDLIEKHHYLLNSLLERRGRTGRWMSINHSDDELLYLVYYPLLLLEKDPDRRRILVQSITRTWEDAPGEQGIRGEHSPLYNFIYGATTGKPCDVDQAVRTLQDWPWDMVDWSVKNSHRHDIQIKSSSGLYRTKLELDRVLPASERRLSRWNGNPWAPDGGNDGRTEDDGAAWALAYWIGVYHGYLAKGQ